MADNGMFGFDVDYSGLPGIASGLFGLFGGNKNPSQGANNILNQMPQQYNQYTNPWFQTGQRQLPQLENQYYQLTNNPGQKLNDIGGKFQQSPGFKFALEQALNGAGHAAASGGMAGSPEHEQHNMELATNLGNQDYYNWLKEAMGLYGKGLEGESGLSLQGQKAGQSQADLIAQIMATQANMSREDELAKNKGFGSALGDVAGGLGKMFFG